MGIVMPETCWAAYVQQGNKFYSWLVHLVGCFIRLIEDARNHKPYLLHCSNPRVHFQNGGCTYRHGIICLHTNGMSSLPPTRLLIPLACKQIIPYLYVQPTFWRWPLSFETYRRHCKNISLTKVHFVALYYMITLQCTVQKTLKNIYTVGSRFATVRFMTIHFYDPCPVGSSTPDLWCVTVATQASFLYSVRF
jgi:hypothetical protein